MQRESTESVLVACMQTFSFLPDARKANFVFCVPQLYLWSSPFWRDFCVCDFFFFFFLSSHWGSHILFSWMMHAGCVFVVGIHASSTRMSGSLESVRRNACVRDQTPVYTLIRESFEAKKSESKGKSPLPEAQRRIEPTTLHHAGQRDQHTTDWAIPAPEGWTKQERKHLYISVGANMETVW